MIITTPEFEDQSLRQAAWKTQKGLLAKVRTVLKGTTPAHIKYGIKNAYDNWNPAPAYVLLFGDSDLITPCHQTQHPSTNDAGVYTYGDSVYIASYCHYFTVDGDDYLPGMVYG